jgi:signal peptidase II
MLYVLVLVLAAVDQLIKYFILKNVELHHTISVIKGFFSITHVENTGGAFSFLSTNSWGIIFLASVSTVVSIVLLIMIFRMRNKGIFWIRFFMAVLAGGSIGNLIDRIRIRSVIDYLMFSFGSYTFAIFNFADMCVVVSSISLALILIFDKKNPLFEKDNAIMKNNNHFDEDGDNIIG